MKKIDIYLRDKPAVKFWMFDVKIIWNLPLASYHQKEVFLDITCTNTNHNLLLKQYFKN
jgi:hypothetical protein